MYSVVFLGLISFLLALILTPVVRDRFRSWGVVDHPDGDRKHHAHPVPRVGGIPLVVAYICSLGILSLTPLSAGKLVVDAMHFGVRFLPAVLLIFGTGLLDDLVGLKPWQKLIGQLAAAGGAYWAGIHVQAFGGHEFAAWLSLPLTVFWLVLCCNAINLIDGVDGLATGVGLFAAFTMLLAAMLQANFPLAVATVPLVGCLLGFLRYNFNPATIFLGDSGSLFLGFLLGCYGVRWSEKSATILGMTAPLMALAIPLLDTGLSIVRRFLRGKPIFGADRGHIHHRLLDRGLTPRRVALTFYGLCTLAAIFSLTMASYHFEGLVVLLFCVATWVGIHYLGYVELGVVARMFFEGAFRRMLTAQINLQQHQQVLARANTPQECWAVIETAAREFGFEQARMEFGGYRFEYTSDAGRPCAWNLSIPLSEFDYVELSAPLTDKSSNGVVASFASMIHRGLTAKLSWHGAALNDPKARRPSAAAAPR
jgi:UDP-GlcNAc:undecaprenyl-phosphate GlcNAc-1-phosphate transferase